MNRLLLPLLLIVIATTSLLLLGGQVSPSLVPLGRGHHPADYGASTPLAVVSRPSQDASRPGHSTADYTANPGDALVERGRYLVNQASLCIDCHTPHGPQGPVMEQHLHGSPLPFKPTIDMPWADVAPRIAGLVVFNEAHVRTLLTTGKRPDGSSPRPPMPPYRLNDADTDAIIAYLKTVR